MNDVRRLISILGLSLGVAGPALAASDWSASVGTNCTVGNTNTAWNGSATSSGVDCGSVYVQGMSASDMPDAAFSASAISFASGYGLSVHGGDTHAIDNVGKVEAVLLRFDSSVVLSQLTLGWRETDWDLTVHAYTGNVPFSGNIGDLALANPVDTGWSLIGNYSNLAGEVACSSNCAGSGKLDRSVNSGGVSSSWWIVSAYDSTWGSNWSEDNDKFKLLAFAGTSTTPPDNNGNVPEPASLALVGVALAGVWGSRRRKARAA